MTKTYFRTYEIQFSIPASQPANSIVAGTFVNLANGKTESDLQAPGNQIWDIVDIYIRSSSDDPLDATVTFTRDDVNNLITTDPLSSLVVTNPSRPRYPAIRLNPNQRLSATATTLAANGTSAVTDVVFVKVQVTDLSS